MQVTDGLVVTVIKESQHEFLMSSKDVALGYGIAESTIGSNKHNS
ncbi:MAG: hypothetical protein U5L45_05310 [Saprospiraceae bacterium]|nr:hypothetical protein [Saprospiraceae bacterium]